MAPRYKFQPWTQPWTKVTMKGVMSSVDGVSLRRILCILAHPICFLTVTKPWTELKGEGSTEDITIPFSENCIFEGVNPIGAKVKKGATK